MFLFGSKGFKPVGFRYWGVMGRSMRVLGRIL